MTREEAIVYGKRVIGLGLNDETQAFCELAIKALEQEPCEDAVSRSEVKKIAKEMYLEVANMELDINTISDCISYTSSKCREVLERKLQALPPVTPQEHKWIPVTERSPEEQDEYLVTWTAEAFRDKPFIQMIEFDIEDRGWILERYMKEMYRDVTITAWMPLPEPYKEENVE